MESEFTGQLIPSKGRGVKFYYKGKLLENHSVITEEFDKGESSKAYEIWNDTPVTLINLKLETDYPIKSVEGPTELLPGQRGHITIYVDIDKLLWTKPDPSNPGFGEVFSYGFKTGGPLEE